MYFSLNQKPWCIQHLKKRVLPRVVAFPVCSVWHWMFESVIKLKIYATKTNKIHTFQINVLIQFLVFYTCFEHNVFIIRKIICTCSFLCHVISCIYISNLADGMMCASFHLLDCLCKCMKKHDIKNCMYK